VEGVISERQLLPTELRIRYLLQEKERVGPLLAPILVKLNEWTASIHDQISNCKAAKTDAAPEVIQQLAESFTETLKIAPGVQWALVSKSLQEALFYSVDLDADLSLTLLKDRLERLGNQQNRMAFLKGFLSLYFFNYVWFFHIENSSRTQVLSPQSLEEDLERVDKLCQQAVSSAFSSCVPDNLFVLDSHSAEELIEDIEERIRGV
jgi:hypothetical protein